MKFRKGAGEPIARSQVAVLTKEMSDAELDLRNEIQNSKRNAWRVASGAFAFALACLVVLGIVVVQYAQPVPASILAYNMNDPASIQEVSLTADKKSYGELTDNYWVGQFILAYESYDYTTIARYYEQVGLMAMGNVATDYKAIYAGKDARDKQWGNTRTITTDVISVLRDEKTGTATIRFKTVQRTRQRGVDDPPQYWIATVGYRYVKDPMKASQRLLNPLGFKITSYVKRAEAANNVVGG